MKASNITCSIILIGTELTEGRIRDLNGMFLASEMKRRSIPVREIVSVSDDLDTIVTTLKRLSESNTIVFVSGGLGPTSDDITREAVAAVAGVVLESNKECVQHLKSRGIRHAWSANVRQTLIPEGFNVIVNENGTACGFWGMSKAVIFTLPGPPRELKPMFNRRVAGLLAERFHLESPPEMCFSVFLVPESMLEEALKGSGKPSVSWSTRVEEHRIVVILRGESLQDIEAVYDAVEETLGRNRVSPGETEAAILFSEALRDRKRTVVCAESCTGGLAAKLLTEEPGSSDIFWGSFVTYRNAAKLHMLGINNGALEEAGPVSEEVVSEMCGGALEKSDADIAVAVTGYAGPSLQEDREPVGTVWIGAQIRGRGVQTKCFDFGMGRNRIRRMAAVATILFGKSVLESDGRLDSDGNWGYI